MRRIESEVGEYALGANRVGPERRPGLTGANPILWKTEIQNTLGALRVCSCYLGVLKFLIKLPQRDLELHVTPRAQSGFTNPLASAPLVVRRPSLLYRSPLTIVT